MSELGKRTGKTKPTGPTEPIPYYAYIDGIDNEGKERKKDENSKWVVDYKRAREVRKELDRKVQEALRKAK